MKKSYEKPEVEVVLFDREDIVMDDWSDPEPPFIPVEPGDDD